MTTGLGIIAVAARTPVGLSAEPSAAAVRAGISRLREHPTIVDLDGEPLVCAMDSQIDPALDGPERLLLLLRGALDELAFKLRNLPRNVGRVHVLLALPEVRPGFSDGDAAWLADEVRQYHCLSSFDSDVDIAGRGHAGAIRAIERAVQASSTAPRGDLHVIVGVDGYFQLETLGWLDAKRRLARSNVRNGFYPGEAAGCLVVAKSGSYPGLPPLARVCGVRTTREPRPQGQGMEVLGEGLSRAVKAAMADLDPARDAIDDLYCDINGERYRSEEWGFAALRTPGAWMNLEYRAPTDCWGDIGAASAALASVLVTQSFVRNYARGPHALVVAGSEGGLRGAVLFGAPGCVESASKQGGH